VAKKKLRNTYLGNALFYGEKRYLSLFENALLQMAFVLKEGGCNWVLHNEKPHDLYR
jgi:hypothetical protein